MRDFSNFVSAIIIVIGFFLTLFHGSIFSIIGLFVFSIGLYRIISTQKRRELFSILTKVESLPIEQRKVTIDEIIKKTSPETWHLKLIILILVVFVIFLLSFLFYTYFDVSFIVKPRKVLKWL